MMILLLLSIVVTRRRGNVFRRERPGQRSVRVQRWRRRKRVTMTVRIEPFVTNRKVRQRTRGRNASAATGTVGQSAHGTFVRRV